MIDEHKLILQTILDKTKSGEFSWRYRDNPCSEKRFVCNVGDMRIDIACSSGSTPESQYTYMHIQLFLRDILVFNYKFNYYHYEGFLMSQDVKKIGIDVVSLINDLRVEVEGILDRNEKSIYQQSIEDIFTLIGIEKK